MTTLRMLGREIRHNFRLFWRVPIAAFFTVAFPIMVLALLNLLTGDQATAAGRRFAEYLTPTIAVFGLVTSVYTGLAIQTSTARDAGILKRVRGTPLPASIHLAGRIGSSLAVGLLSVVIMAAIGAVAFGVPIPWSRLPLLILLLAVGAACFAALGLAVAGVAPNSQAAQAMANATILPLALISGIFYPLEGGAAWLGRVADLFPLRPLAAAVAAQWRPGEGPPFPGVALATLALWLAAGMWVAVRRFTWEPRTPGRRRRPGRVG